MRKRIKTLVNELNYIIIVSSIPVAGSMGIFKFSVTKLAILEQLTKTAYP